MANVRLNNMRSVRRALGRSQSEFGALLGISTRAVQSYEQGWRPIPPYVQKLAGLLVFLNWQKSHPNPPACWEVMGCDEPRRSACCVYQMKGGDFCWMLNRGCLPGPTRPWQVKLAHCSKCPVMKRWLNPG